MVYNRLDLQYFEHWMWVTQSKFLTLWQKWAKWFTIVHGTIFSLLSNKTYFKRKILLDHI